MLDRAGKIGENAYATAFALPLLNPRLAVPISVSGPTGKSAQKRYNVYRNNVVVSLVNALAAIFPATKRITGRDFFRAMARDHVRTTPPSSPLLFEYGRDFPQFIQCYKHARSVPWLADVARIERAWLDSYHAADAEPLSLERLFHIPPERLANVVLRPHPATRIVRSRFSAVSIYAANRSDTTLQRIDAAKPEDALITRPDQEVFVRRLPPGGAAFVSSLMVGEGFGAAAAAAFGDSASFDLSANIAGILEAGAFVKIEREASDDDA